MPVRCILLGLAILLHVMLGPALGDDRDSPSLEMLEFLGGFETADGEWLDPAELEQITLPDEQEQEDGDPQAL